VGLSSGVKQSDSKTTLETKVKTNQLSDEIKHLQKKATCLTVADRT
jgi:hypothetical protein